MRGHPLHNHNYKPMHILVSYFVFLLVYIFGNNLVSIPTGLALGINQLVVIGTVIGLDFLQIPFFFYLYEQGQSRFRIVRWLFSILPNQDWVQDTFLKRIIEHTGRISVMLITALPSFGGGIWSGVLVSHILKLDRRHSIFFIMAGAVMSTLIVWGGSATIWLIIKNVFHLVVK